MSLHAGLVVVYARHMSRAERESIPRTARLFRNGRNQAVRIPRDLEFAVDEVYVYRDGDRLVLEPVQTRSRLLEHLAEWQPIEDEFPDIDQGVPPLDDIDV